MSTTSAAATAPVRQGRALHGPSHLFNSLVMLLAGTRIFPLYGVIEHRGRRSGKVFRTPVVVRPTSDGFVVPMPWGQGTDWFRNVRAAGECTIRWRGRVYSMVKPEVLDAAAARAFFSPVQQKGLSRFGITQCLRLYHRA